MTDNELIEKIKTNPILSRTSENLFSEVTFRAGTSAQFAIITILTAISIVVQIISLCQQQHDDETLADWCRNARIMPRFRTARLRRRLNELWREQCGNDSEERGRNALFDAILDLGENVSDDELKEVFRLASEIKIKDDGVNNE
jgi:hypothetical protein